MIWIKSLEGNYVNIEQVLSLAYDKKCKSYVAVVGYLENGLRLQYKIFQSHSLENVLAGTPPKSETEIIEEMIELIELAKDSESSHSKSKNILDFNELIND